MKNTELINELRTSKLFDNSPLGNRAADALEAAQAASEPIKRVARRLNGYRHRLTASGRLLEARAVVRCIELVAEELGKTGG